MSNAGKVEAGEKYWYLKFDAQEKPYWIQVTILEVKKRSVIYYDETGSAFERMTTVPSFCFLKNKPFALTGAELEVK